MCTCVKYVYMCMCTCACVHAKLHACVWTAAGTGRAQPSTKPLASPSLQSSSACSICMYLVAACSPTVQLSSSPWRRHVPGGYRRPVKPVTVQGLTGQQRHQRRPVQRDELPWLPWLACPSSHVRMYVLCCFSSHQIVRVLRRGPVNYRGLSTYQARLSVPGR